MFGADVLDAADLAACGYVLLSEDLYYRQMATEAVGANAKGASLQSILAFAREKKLITEDRYAAMTVRLAWRRHSHVWLDAETLFQAWQSDRTDNLADFTALAEFIGTRNAEMQSHLTVVIAFLNRIGRCTMWPLGGSLTRPVVCLSA
jgi:cellulose synthase operon protein C